MMTRIKLVAVFALLGLGAITMQGQSTQVSRTWVSSFGSDANPCSRTAPCKTFAGALAQTLPGGEIDVLDPGSYGAVTVAHAVTIDGGGQIASVMVSSGNGIVVQAGANDVVTLRNLQINGLGSGTNGIRFLSGKSLHVENTTVSGFSSSGIDIEKSDGGNAYISNTVLKNNGLVGLFAKNTVSNVAVTFTNSISKDTPFGVAAQDFSRVTVFNSEISGCTNTGLQVATPGGPATLEVYNSILAHSTKFALVAEGTGIANISGLAMFDNASGITVFNSGVVNSFHNNYNSGTGVPNGTIAPQ